MSRFNDYIADTIATDFSNQSHLASARGLTCQTPLFACNYQFFQKMDLIVASSH